MEENFRKVGVQEMNLPDSAMEYFQRSLEIRVNYFMPGSREIMEVTNAIRITQEEINKQTEA